MFCCYLSRAMFEKLNNFPNVNLSNDDSMKVIDILKNNFYIIKNVFKENNIKMDIVTITSNYNGIVTSKSGIDIILEDVNIQIPNDLYKMLESSISTNTIKKPPTISFGYLMRSLYGQRAGVTYGNYNADDNKISFDIFTCELFDYEALCLKLIHELLHSFGYGEVT